MLSAPEDYGLGPDQTLGHVTTSSVPDGFDVHWEGFREEVASLAAPRLPADAAGVGDVTLPSTRAVRVVGRLSVPGVAPASATVRLHGYVAGGFDASPADGRRADGPPGQVVLELRVRGFHPSTLDIDETGMDWILRSIESPDAWILRGAIADVVQAVRALRRRFGDDLPISIEGESFGGGLAVLAAAQLTAMGDGPFSLVIGLPSLGDWPWRLGRYCNGSGGLVNMMAEALRADERGIMERGLRLHDAALHARAIRCPVLCKLALRDDTVPAPAAAAVCNAIGTPSKWSFVTSFGHFDGGIADARRHLHFQRVSPDFTDPHREREEVLRDLGAGRIG